VARWHESICLRSHGDNCQICVDACPVGARALIVADDGRIDVREGCTGCGTCQHACPTQPKSITVLPKSAR
jgi:ferredoxin-type protein NapG